MLTKVFYTCISDEHVIIWIPIKLVRYCAKETTAIAKDTAIGTTSSELFIRRLLIRDATLALSNLSHQLADTAQYPGIKVPLAW